MGIEVLLGLVIVPTVKSLRDWLKWLDKVPLVTLLLVGCLSYGVAFLYQGVMTGAWVVTPEVLEMTMNQAIVAVVGKAAWKTKQKLGK